MKTQAIKTLVLPGSFSVCVLLSLALVPWVVLWSVIECSSYGTWCMVLLILVPGLKYSASLLGDNCIHYFHLGRYIVGYTVGYLVLRRRVS